jgi:replicative DNA helicase
MTLQDKSYPERGYSKLDIQTSLNAAAAAHDVIADAKAGNRVVMASRWDKLNYMLLGGFQFGQTYMLCGASGHGKSYMLNMLLRDFTNPTLQKDVSKTRILHFSFEMSAAAEMTRRISTLTGISYRKLLSADRPLTQEEYEQVKVAASRLTDEPIFFVETPGNRMQIRDTIDRIKQKYPDDDLVVTLDHTLLATPMPGENEIQTLAELGKMFIDIRKEFGTLNILLSQLNDKIESSSRRDPSVPSLHFPTKTDIHGSKQLYHAADVCLVMHQPALLGLEVYGPDRVPTMTEDGKNLISMHVLKNRHGTQGYTRMIANLENGRIDPWTDGYRADQASDGPLFQIQ